MTAEQCWIGIDAGADTVAICILDSSGNIVSERQSDASAVAISEVLPASRDALVVGLEAGAAAIHLAKGLRKVGYNVRVLETRHVHAFLGLRQNKSDRNDARGIADILRLGWQSVPEVLVKSERSQRLRSELVLRHRLMQQRMATESAMRGILRVNGGKINRAWSGTHLEKSVVAEIERLRADDIDLSEVLLPTLEAVVAVRRTLETITRRLTRIARDDDVCSRLMTVPGVGCISALSFYTAIDDPSRFARNEDVGPYLGLVPKLNQSGQSSRMGRISKRGNQMTRGHLVSAAKVLMQLSKQDNDLRHWAIDLKRRAGPSKARVALARKLAVVLLAIWKAGTVFDPHPNAGPKHIDGTASLSGVEVEPSLSV
ncbi:IS110 family transposase [Sphingomonas kyeonggiensis]|uniref:Transposase n=1 Tax=Sphingomonas kyeonggiensis TaxID=1268553 RepID=A0A7W6NZH6_9SPHN|nr:IS110 family transposase [Sphingomonas kyeonggiensis]MBB4101408.1 transposase [Sphingomonas kyeonggiensis]